MQRVQRKFGTFLKRSEDEADIGVILHEFEDTEKFLGSVRSLAVLSLRTVLTVM